jgi:hypothetical protein
MLARTPAAMKKRRYRRRLRDGLVVLHLEMVEADLVEALCLAGRLSEAEAVRRSALEHAAAEVLAEWAARWLHKR